MSRSKVAVLVFLGLLVLVSPQARADSGCIQMSAQGQATSIDPTNPFDTYKGSWVVTFDGQPPVEATLTIVIENIKVGDDGTIHMVNALTIVMPDGSSLKMADNAVLVPTETPLIYRFNTRLNNFEGTGFFTNAFGMLIAHGTLNLATAHIEGTPDGKICW